ncbi:MAG: DUF2207 domain-containing protein [Bacteroidales bacterium]|nr:DUF2207 domain-containing protein [Bacteroidales bacterium]
MKKSLISLLLLIAAAFSLSAQEIRNIDETVVLRKDGSARITQVWDVTVVSGTEFYLPFDNLGPMEIDDLTVSENGEEFFAEGDGWDTDRSREQKRGRCGIVRKHGGVELCWGQGDYGDHVWTVSYTVRGLVMRMGGYDGLYFSFVNPGLSAPPKHVKVMLINETGGPEWTTDNVKVWGFRSESEIYVEDGAVRAESLESFRSSSAMTVLVRFDQGLFEPAVTYEKDFEKVQKMAFEGSDFKTKMSFWDWIKTIFGGLLVLVCLCLSPGGMVVLGLLIWLVLLIMSAFGYKYKKSFYGKSKITGWSRDIPLQGNLPAAYFSLVEGDMLGGLGGKDYSKNLIGAYFLRWVMNGVVQVLPDPKKQNRVNLSFEQEAKFDEAVENDLYQMVREASGANLILEAGELEKWSKKSFKRISNLPDREKTRGRKWFEDKHYLIKGDKCTPEGQEQARHLIEFKNFLEDFTLHQEKGAVEATLWQDYLVFAALFGIADKVAKQFEKLYPAQFTEFAQTTGLDNAMFYHLMYISHDISASAMRNAMAEKAARSSSGGGRSFGGGGHFSGGGGGGSFGGSFGGGSR